MRFTTQRLLLLRLLLPIGTILVFLGCGTPDLTEPDVYQEAMTEAIKLDSLERKRMYGMIMLYVDSKEEPFTGWVKTETNGSISTLGFISKGQKQGTWMAWHSNGQKLSEIAWENDLMSGSFRTWHENGQVGTIGQTRDGEVDGAWKEYYENGKLEANSINKMGTLVSIEVFMANGTYCKNSKVTQGRGTFIDYDTNGSALRSRTFENGIEINSTWLSSQKP